MTTLPQTPMAEAIPARQWIRLSVAYFLLGAWAWVYSTKADPATWETHGWFCLVGLVVALPTLSQVVFRGFDVVVKDHRLIFLASFAVYFLFGAGLLAFGPQQEADGVLSFYPIGQRDALRADAVNGLGFGIALLTSTLSRGRWIGHLTEGVAEPLVRLPAAWVIGTFLVISGSATLYRLPYDLGLRPGFPPGIVRTLGQLALVSIFMAASGRVPHERTLRSFGVALALVMSLAGLLQFTKTEALLPAVMLTAGLALRFGPRRVLPLGLALIVAFYMSLGNLVSYGRSAVALSSTTSTLADRWIYLKDGWDYTRSLPDEFEYPYWGRVCYVPIQAASMDFRDAGNGGTGMNLILWTLVPRVLAANKPEMTGMFRELNLKISGSDTSAVATGVFVSGYYHAGWWGVLLASLLCGWVVAQTSAIARAIYDYQSPLLTPLALLGMLIASNIGGDFIPDYLGTFVIILYALIAAALFLTAVGSGRRRSAITS